MQQHNSISSHGNPCYPCGNYNRKKGRKRSTEEKPSGILRLAHRPYRCISYPRTETVTRVSAEICAKSGNLTDRALYINTVGRGQSLNSWRQDIYWLQKKTTVSTHGKPIKLLQNNALISGDEQRLNTVLTGGC